jgi:type II secretory pathway pseudopilin PulG
MTGIHKFFRRFRAAAGRRRVLPPGSGFTLVELMVTVGLFMIIVAIATGAFANALRTQRQVSSLIAAQSNVSLAVEQMTRQIRTGYLFCHDSGSNTWHTSCGCHLDPDPAQAALNVWDCSDLDFYSSDGHIEYTALSSGPYAGMLVASSSGQWQPITGNTVRVKYLQFRLFGQLEGDHWTPRVTISMGIVPSSTDTAVGSTTFNLETTVSARQIDCETTGGVIRC